MKDKMKYVRRFMKKTVKPAKAWTFVAKMRKAVACGRFSQWISQKFCSWATVLYQTSIYSLHIGTLNKISFEKKKTKKNTIFP